MRKKLIILYYLLQEILFYLQLHGFKFLLDKYRFLGFKKFIIVCFRYIFSKYKFFSRNYLSINHSELQSINNANFQNAKKVTIVVPIFNAYDEVLQCLNSILKYPFDDLLLINDCSTDKRILPALIEFKKKSPTKIKVVNNKTNLGYTKNVNKAFELTDNDILLLNSDTIVSPNWLFYFKYYAYSSSSVGTVTAVSNNAGAFSIQLKKQPSSLSFESFSRQYAHSSHFTYSVPTGNGFAMYIKKDLLNAIGKYNELKYPIGYGEENDFCMRAMRYGFINLVTTKILIYHHKSKSFKSKAQELKKSGAKKLIDDFPHYKYLITESSFFNKNKNPLPQKNHINIPFGNDLLLKNDISNASNNTLKGRPSKINPKLKTILFVLSNFNGGTSDTSLDFARGLEGLYNIYFLSYYRNELKLFSFFKNDLRLIENILVPSQKILIENDLLFTGQFIKILVNYSIEKIHFRQFFYYPKNLFDCLRKLNMPYLLSLHDHFAFCPQHNLLDSNLKFCNADCTNSKSNEDCNAYFFDFSNKIKLKDHYVKNWRQEMLSVLSQSEHIFVTSGFQYELLKKIYPSILNQVSVVPHQVKKHNIKLLSKNSWVYNKIPILLVLGNVGKHKGLDIISKLIELQEKEQCYQIKIIGSYAKYDKSELNLKKHYLGTYTEDTLNNLVHKLKPALYFQPSLCAETFSRTLSEAIYFGLPSISFDIGAQSERIRENNIGWTININAKIHKINNFIKDLLKNPDDINKIKKNVVSHRKQLHGQSFKKHYSEYIKYLDK